MRNFTLTMLMLPLTLSLASCSSLQDKPSAQSTVDSSRPMNGSSKKAKQQETAMILNGTLKMRGSSRMAHLELVTDHGSYRITNPNAFGLMQKQNRSVRLKVRLVKKAIGPGFPAEVEVISVH